MPVAEARALGFNMHYERADTPGRFTLGMVRTGDNVWHSTRAEDGVTLRVGYRLAFQAGARGARRSFCLSPCANVEFDVKPLNSDSRSATR